MLYDIVQRAAAEGIPGACRLDRLNGKSRALHAFSFIVCAASLFSHREKDERDIIFLLEIGDSLVIILFSGYELDLVVRDLQNVAHSETIFHLFFRKIEG